MGEGDRDRERMYKYTYIKPANVASSSLNQPDWLTLVSVSLYFPLKAINCQVRWNIKSKEDCLDSN
jgi:hypothetical protein